MIEQKEIKQEIKRLRKLKLQCRPGSRERIDLEHSIKALKKQLAEISIPNPGKDKLIAEILKIEPNFPKDLVNLAKFTLEQLRLHIDRVKNKHRPR
jgi:hypothetical protein